MKKDTLYKVLRIVRIANNVSQAQVASKIKLSKSYFCEIENGKRSASDLEMLEKLAKHYNLKLVQLVQLAEYYDELECDDFKKYRLTLMKTLEMISSNLD